MSRMFYDLQGEANMSPTVGLLYAAVRENSERLRAITEGMSPEELDYRGPANDRNSTAQLIRHILFVDLNWVYRIKNEPLPPSLYERFGPMIDADGRLPMVNGLSHDELMAEYGSVLGMLKETCEQLRDEDLERTVSFGHESEKKATLRWGLWHIADHSRYHQAHVNLLRKSYRLDAHINQK